MKNFVQPGHSMTWTNGTGSDVASGDAVLVGSKLGIATTDIAAGATGELSMEGVYTLAKDTAAGSNSTQGNDVYWNSTTKKVTHNTTDGASPPVTLKRIGYFFADCAQADATCKVKLSET